MLKALAKYVDFKGNQRIKLLYFATVLIWIVYFALTLTIPFPKNNVLNISTGTLQVIRISIALVYLITWLAAIYAFIKINSYSNFIKNSKEAKAFNYLSYSVLILIGSLIVATVASSINSHLSNGGTPSPAFVIFTNYCYVFPFLAAFLVLWQGSSLLVKRVKTHTPMVIVGIIGVLFIGFLYLWLNFIFTNELRNSSQIPGFPSTYYLNDSLIVLSIVLPVFIAWILSLATAVNIRNYSQKVQGVIYRRAMSAFFWGISAVILGSVFLQGLQSLGSIRLFKFGLVKLVILIYIFLAIQTIGYLYMALGAKRLTKIETV